MLLKFKEAHIFFKRLLSKNVRLRHFYSDLYMLSLWSMLIQLTPVLCLCYFEHLFVLFNPILNVIHGQNTTIYQISQVWTGANLRRTAFFFIYLVYKSHVQWCSFQECIIFSSANAYNVEFFRIIFQFGDFSSICFIIIRKEQIQSQSKVVMIIWNWSLSFFTSFFSLVLQVFYTNCVEKYDNKYL